MSTPFDLPEKIGLFTWDNIEECWAYKGIEVYVEQWGEDEVVAMVRNQENHTWSVSVPVNSVERTVRGLAETWASVSKKVLTNDS